MKKIFCLLIGIFFLFLSGRVLAENLPAGVAWQMLAVEGADGSLQKDARGNWTLNKTKSEGYLLARCALRPAVTPGEYYRISLEIQAESASVSGYLQVITLPEKRTPYPHSATVTPLAKPRRVSCFLQMGQKESSVILNLVTAGTGKMKLLGAEVTKISAREYQEGMNGPVVSQKEFSALELKELWNISGVMESKIAPDGSWEMTLAPGGGLQIGNLGWDPASVAMLEWNASSSFEGGYWQLDVTSRNASGKTHSGYQTFSAIPDGTMRVHQFPVAQCGAWQGKIESLRFSWNGPAPGKVRLGGLRAIPQENLIPNAKPGQNFRDRKIPLIRPRGEYLLTGTEGFDGEISLVMSDRNGKILQNVLLKAGEKELRFTVPEMCVTAFASLSRCTKGSPVLLQKEIPTLNSAMKKWRGPWIWSRPGYGPERSSVWFRKRFTLPEEPVEAQLVITADDQLKLIRINQSRFVSGNSWQNPKRFDIARALHRGENEILIQVFNTETAGGLLLDADIRGKNGNYSLWSDGSWESAESETMPAQWHPGSFVLGRVPYPPWGEIVFPEKENSDLPENAVNTSARYPLSPAKVIRKAGRLQILAGKELLLPVYMDMPGRLKEKPAAKTDLIRNARAIGSRMIRIHFRTLDAWKSENQFDFSKFDRMMSVVLKEFPEAHVLVVMDFAMPEWWLKQHPGSATAFADGTPRGWRDAQTLASELWLHDLRKMVRAFVSHVQTRPYAGALLGLTVGEGWNLEWMWSLTDGKNRRNYSGFAPEAIECYRQFLRGKYKTDSALSQAWGRTVKFAEVMPPGKRRDESSGEGTLLDLSRDRDVADFFQFRNECIGRAICRIARIVKEESGGNWLAGVYYGYLVPFSYSYHQLQERGHLAIEMVAHSPDVDFIVGPSYYHWRRMGMSDGVMQPADTFLLRDKLLITEHDIRTFSDASHYEAKNGRVNSVEESVGVMERAFGMMLTKGSGLHWMEMNETWFREKVLLDLAASFTQILGKLPPVRNTTPREVCVVSDIDSLYCLKSNAADGISQLCISEFLRRLPEAGFAWRHVTQRDLLEPGVVPPHKFYIMTNSLLMPQKTWNALQKRFDAEKAAVLWLYAPGLYRNGFEAPDFKRTEKLLKIELTPRPAPLRLIPEALSPAWQDFQFSLVQTGPCYLPTRKKISETLTVNKGDKTALLVRCPDTPKGGAVYFSAYPVVSPKLCRELAQRAGVHCYGKTGDSYHIGQDVIVLHAKTGGKKQLTLPSGFSLRQIFGPPVTLQNGSFSAAAGRTYGFLVEMMNVER